LVELAAGGMATVYLARAADKREGPPLVAVKRPHRHLANDKTFLTMLVDEARLASAIQHDNVVKVRELGFEAGIPFIVMDYVEGASLAELRRELAALGRAMDTKVAVRVMLDALAGLHAAHQLRDDNGRPLNVIHRDVSPHNVLIGCDGRAHLTDFGIAKAEDRVQVTRTHEVKGKLAYLAPERIDKRRLCTVQSDVFSLAVVLWECFAGRRLFRGEDAVDILQEVMSAPIPTLRQIGAPLPPALDDVIARALSRDLETRYGNAAELGAAIERAAGPENIGTHADVARLMEAIFGPRMAMRHGQIRQAVGADVDSLLTQSGLPARERVSSLDDRPSGVLLSELPPVPSGRYPLHVEVAKLRPRRVPWWIAAAVGGGLVAGVAITLAVMSPKQKLGPIVVRGAPPPPTTVASAPRVRKVVVALPFLSTRVTFDDASRELSPATDIVAFDVPVESGVRHRVTAIALDGTRAEAYVRESDGMGQPEGDGFAFVAASTIMPTNETRPSPPSVPPAKPLGTTRNGFTRLK
jgi:serine/threonine-protein kinase